MADAGMALEKTRAADITFQDIEAASASREGALSLLGHLAVIARANEGGANLLFALAHIATQPWVRGGIRVRMRADGESTAVEVVDDIGGGHRVPFWTAKLAVPLAEFTAALLHLLPRLRPLRLVRQREDLIVLGVSTRGRYASMKPPAPSEPPGSSARPSLPDIPPPPALPSVPAEDEVDTNW